MVNASNVVLRGWTGPEDDATPVVFKPDRGERPLWDFPQGTLATREYCSYLVSDALGWDLVPRTALVETDLGRGSVQLWVGPTDGHQEHDLVRVDRPDEVPPDHLPVLQAEDEDGSPLVVSHADAPWLRHVALLDVVLNNADRKASALLPDADRHWAIDHGLTFHTEPKLRTVLWGFAGDSVGDDDLAALRTLAAAVEGDLGEELKRLLTEQEVLALSARTTDLLDRGTFPEAPVDRHPLPWPLW